jgi:hypothetical protein
MVLAQGAKLAGHFDVGLCHNRRSVRGPPSLAPRIDLRPLDSVCFGPHSANPEAAEFRSPADSLPYNLPVEDLVRLDALHMNGFTAGVEARFHANLLPGIGGHFLLIIDLVGRLRAWIE